MESELDVQDFLNFTVNLARHCGETVLEHFIKTGRNAEAVEKADKTNVTHADLTIQYILEQAYQERFPGLKVRGEEDIKGFTPDPQFPPFKPETIPEVAKTSEVHFPLADCTLWIDPVDATNCFVRGDFSSVTIIIGLAVRGEARAGVVHA